MLTTVQETKLLRELHTLLCAHTGLQPKLQISQQESDKLGESNNGTLTVFPTEVRTTVAALHADRLRGVPEDRKHGLLLAEVLAHEFMHQVLDTQCYTRHADGFAYNNKNRALIEHFRQVPKELRFEMVANTSVRDTEEDLQYAAGNTRHPTEECLMIDRRLYSKNNLLQAHEWSAQMGGQLLLNQLIPMLQASANPQLQEIGTLRSRMLQHWEPYVQTQPVPVQAALSSLKAFLPPKHEMGI